MTLNGVIALILRYFTEFDRLGGRIITLVEDRPIRFGAEYRFPLISWPKLAHAVVASTVSATAELLVKYFCTSSVKPYFHRSCNTAANCLPTCQSLLRKLCHGVVIISVGLFFSIGSFA